MTVISNENSTNTPGLPQRPSSHVIGDQAVLALRTALPKHWIFRETQPDYGIDCEIEIVHSDGTVTGAIIKGQVKGTASSVEVRESGLSVATNSIRYWLALPVPVIIVRVIQDHSQVLWLDVRQYLLERDRLDTIYSTKQRTLSFNFQDAYSLPANTTEFEQLAVEHQTGVGEMRVATEADVVSQFVGYVILIRLYDGDVDAWIQWLREKGSIEQLVHDFPFVVWVKEQVEKDPDLLARIRKMVEEAA